MAVERGAQHLRTSTVVETFPVVGVTNAAYTRPIESLSRSVSGVPRAAEVSVATGTVTIEYDPLEVQASAVASFLREFGYDLAQTNSFTTVLTGASHEKCCAIEQLNGVDKVQSTVQLPRVDIHHDSEKLAAEQLEQVVEQVRFPLGAQ